MRPRIYTLSALESAFRLMEAHTSSTVKLSAGEDTLVNILSLTPMPCGVWIFGVSMTKIVWRRIWLTVREKTMKGDLLDHFDGVLTFFLGESSLWKIALKGKEPRFARDWACADQR